MHKMQALRYHFWVAIDASNQNGGVPIRTPGKAEERGYMGKNLGGEGMVAMEMDGRQMSGVLVYYP